MRAQNNFLFISGEGEIANLEWLGLYANFMKRRRRNQLILNFIIRRVECVIGRGDCVNRDNQDYRQLLTPRWMLLGALRIFAERNHPESL